MDLAAYEQSFFLFLSSSVCTMLHMLCWGYITHLLHIYDILRFW